MGGDRVVIRGARLGRGDTNFVQICSRRARVLHADEDGTEITVQTRRFANDEAGSVCPVVVHSAIYGPASFRGFQVHSPSRITAIQPQQGPCQGGTHLMIRGDNLLQRGDSEMSVTVAGTPARVLRRTPHEILVQSSACLAGATQGVVQLSSKLLGKVSSPWGVKFRYNALPRLRGLRPATGSYQGGEQLELRGERLCVKSCEGVKIQIGDATIQHFHRRGPRRLVFRSPSAKAVGGPGAHRVVLISPEMGRMVIPAAFEVRELGQEGLITPNNCPMEGCGSVVIEAPDVGYHPLASSYSVSLAGVPATVVSFASNRLVVIPGQPQHFKDRVPPHTHGLQGDVVVTAQVEGKTLAKDLGIKFTYNPQCVIHTVATRQGPSPGTKIVLLAGENLGFGDEQILVDGTEALVHNRQRRGTNVRRHHLTVTHTGGEINLVELQSPRSGTCVWNHQSQVQPIY